MYNLGRVVVVIVVLWLNIIEFVIKWEWEVIRGGESEDIGKGDV